MSDDPFLPAPALGILETHGLTPALVALDVMEKSAPVRVVEAELNDARGYVLKIVGPIPAVATALQAARTVAEQMGGHPIVHQIGAPDRHAWKGVRSVIEYNPLIQQPIVFQPDSLRAARQIVQEAQPVSQPESFALGLIETQGFTAVFEAVDTACKTANVEVIGKEKLGGGYVTVILKGDVAAVKAAVQAGAQRVEGLGKLIAAHVIARPSPSVLSLLPRSG